MSAFGCPHCEGYAVTTPETSEGIYLLDEYQLSRLREVQAKLHSGNDAMRDLGHILWYVLNQVEGK